MATILITLASIYFVLQIRNIIIENIRYKRAKRKHEQLTELAGKIQSLIDRGIELNVHIIELYMKGDVDGAELLKEQADADVKKIEKLCKEYDNLVNL